VRSEGGGLDQPLHAAPLGRREDALAIGAPGPGHQASAIEPGEGSRRRRRANRVHHRPNDDLLAPRELFPIEDAEPRRRARGEVRFAITQRWGTSAPRPRGWSDTLAAARLARSEGTGETNPAQVLSAGRS
jgi:hypothetical protein